MAPLFNMSNGIINQIDDRLFETISGISTRSGLRKRSNINPFLMEAKAAAAEDKTEIYNEDNSYRSELVNQALNDAVTQALGEDAQTVTRDVTLGLIYQDGAWWVVPDQALLQIISGVA